jgi:outer membrane lipoprotein-sorting protein
VLPGWATIGLATALLVPSLFSLRTAFAEAPAEELPAIDTSERPQSWYAATVAEDEKGSFLMVHFWSRGVLFRSEAVLAGRRIVTIVDRDTYYVIDAVGGRGISIARSEAAKLLDAARPRPFGNELQRLLLEGGELIGTESAGGRTVDVFRVTNDRGRRTIWMSTTSPPIPLRIETYDRASATTGKLDYVNWLHNPSIPESFFAPDPRWQIEHFEYQAYRKRIRRGPVGPAPVLYRHLLHGEGQPAQPRTE